MLKQLFLFFILFYFLDYSKERMILQIRNQTTWGEKQMELDFLAGEIVISRRLGSSIGKWKRQW
jgi:hypothetical protein